MARFDPDTATRSELARRLDQVRASIRHLRETESDLVSRLAETAAEDTEILPDLDLGGEWRIEVHRGKDYEAWDSEAILGRLAAVTSVDADGVRLPDDVARKALIEAVSLCVPLTGSLGWRRKGLKLYGVDPKEYAETKDGRTTVQVVYQAAPAGSEEHNP